MVPLTVHLIVKDDEKTIKRALESVASLHGHLRITDNGSKDGTVALCRQYTSAIRRSLIKDRSRIRNDMVEGSRTEWQLYLEPWEILLSGHEAVHDLCSQDVERAYLCGVMQGDLMVKQIRLWRKDSGGRFVNPVFETLRMDAGSCDVIVWTPGRGPDERAIDGWVNECPLRAEPLYYKSCCLLGQGRHKEFLAYAEQYLFRDPTNSMAAIMTRYYCGIVQCYLLKDTTAALRNAIICVGERPLMAEFWCLLGDIYFQSKQFSKAKEFYENAPVLGGRRLREDPWPMHLSKYQEYPAEMAERCRKILGGAKVITV